MVGSWEVGGVWEEPLSKHSRETLWQENGERLRRAKLKKRKKAKS